MISFIIALLCCRDHSFEHYASYPFKEDEKNTPSIDSSLQEIIFKYNTIVDEQRAGGIHSNERGKIDKELVKTAVAVLENKPQKREQVQVFKNTASLCRKKHKK